jgi:hypothetical protein
MQRNIRNLNRFPMNTEMGKVIKILPTKKSP